jgi:hypothetical protein
MQRTEGSPWRAIIPMAARGCKEIRRGRLVEGRLVEGLLVLSRTTSRLTEQVTCDPRLQRQSRFHNREGRRQGRARGQVLSQVARKGRPRGQTTLLRPEAVVVRFGPLRVKVRRARSHRSVARRVGPDTTSASHVCAPPTSTPTSRRRDVAHGAFRRDGPAWSSPGTSAIRGNEVPCPAVSGDPCCAASRFRRVPGALPPAERATSVRRQSLCSKTVQPRMFATRLEARCEPSMRLALDLLI